MQLPTTLINHPSLVGIVRLPFCSSIDTKLKIPFIINKDNTWYSGIQPVDSAEHITGYTIKDVEFTVPKSDICDFYPYTYYVLTDGETEPLILQPQYMKDNSQLRSRVAISHSPVERYYIYGYKGDYSGRVYNITNTSCMSLPTATNEGLSNIINNSNSNQATSENLKLSAITSIGNGIASGVSSGLMSGNIGVGVASGLLNSVNGAISGYSSIKSNNARNRDLLLTPNSINSWGTPSTRDKFLNNEVRVLKYTIQDKYKEKIRGFTKRYGYKYNNYKKVDLKSYKGFIKYGSVDLDTGIEYQYQNKLKEILERGVYIE